jgi:hypothetical protein
MVRAIIARRDRDIGLLIKVLIGIEIVFVFQPHTKLMAAALQIKQARL